LRSLVPKALEVLAGELEKDGPGRLKAACEVLKLAQLPAGSHGIGWTEPEEIVKDIVLDRRAEARRPLEDHLEETTKNLPPFDRQVEQVWAELEARAAEGDGPAP